MALPTCLVSSALLLCPVQNQTATPVPGQRSALERPRVEVQDLGVYQILGEDGRWLLLSRKESTLAVDLNGDGDTLDEVFAVHDLQAGTTTNLGLAEMPLDQPALGGGRALVSVRESDQGVDLNADGDTQDSVIFVVDLASATSTNSGLANSEAVNTLLIDHWAVFAVSESAQGNTDLDASGTVSGDVLFAWDLDAATAPVSLQIAVEFPGPVAHETFVLAGGVESKYPASDPRSDLNGDGDSLDSVLLIYDLNAPTPVNTGLLFSKDIRAVGAHSAIPVSEVSQGADLNGDADTTDTVLFTFDTHTGILTNLGLASGPASISAHGGTFPAAALRMNEEALAFPVSEAEQGHTDLNGDGDAVDSVLFVRDYATGATLNLGVSVYEYTLGGRLVCMQVSEAGEGVDLDDDGDWLDHVAQVRDLDAGANWNLGLGMNVFNFRTPFAIHGTSIAFQGNEEQTNDWNGDGDDSDHVLFLADASAQTITSLRMAVSEQVFGPDGTLSFSVHEGEQGADLDGDGIPNHSVFHVRSPTGLLNSTHRPAVSPMLPGLAHRHPIQGPVILGQAHVFVARTRF